MQPVTDHDEDRAWKVALMYAPVYAIGNLCIGASAPKHKHPDEILYRH